MSGTQPQGFNVRGYMFLTSVGYMRKSLGEQEAKRLIDGFSPQARDMIGTAKAADWVPVSVFSEVTQALALSGGDEERSRELLIKCGVHMAEEATNTFFKLVMKMLSVQLFVKKLPDFWKRDCSGGKLVVKDLNERSLTFSTFEMEGFKHAVCTAAGFVSFAVRTMGKDVDQVNIRGWSVDKPSADGATFELTWRN